MRDATNFESEPSGRVLIRWAPALESLKVLGRHLRPEIRASLAPVARELLEPLVLLEEFERLVGLATSGDLHASQSVKQSCQSLCNAGAKGLFAALIAPVSFPPSQPCSCNPGTESKALERGVPYDGREVVDEAAAVELMLGVARLAAHGSHIARGVALDGFARLLIGTVPIAQLTQAYQVGGTHALAAMVREGGGGPAVQQLMSSSGVPGFDGMPQWPDLPGAGEFEWPDGLSRLKEILLRLKNRKVIDPDIWEPLPPFQRDPIIFLPPRWVELQKCLREVALRMEARAALPPPVRPARAVFSDVITNIDQPDPCAGQRIVIHGTGFAALWGVARLLLPSHDGCRPVDVPAGDWTDPAIAVTLPQDVSSGPVGFVDAAYLSAYEAWVAEQNRLADEIRGFYCYRQAGPLSMAAPFRECPPDRAINRLRAGKAVIKAFTVNGHHDAWVEPGTPLELSWTVVNAASISITRSGAPGPMPGGGNSVSDPPTSSLLLGPFNGDIPNPVTYTLKAMGPCGDAQAEVTVRLTKVPVLRILGVEVTQGIQFFGNPEPDNSIPLVSHKDTVVRVHVGAEGLNGFKWNVVDKDRVRISGELKIDGQTFMPDNGASALALRADLRERRRTAHTLNFKIPAALAQGIKTLRVRAWTSDEIPTAPSGEMTRPNTPYRAQEARWFDKKPFKIRYVRVSENNTPAPSDASARDLLLRAFDLLASPPLDIAPARLATWHTTQNLDTKEGTETLLGHIDDQHDCSFSEWLLPWEDECPDDDGAVWVAVIPRLSWGGMAQGYRFFDVSRNTAVAPPDRVVTAHEMAHTLSLNHVKVGGGFDEDEDFDTLPNGGAIREEDAFDPTAMKTLSDVSGGVAVLYDFMSYAPTRWVSPTNWNRTFSKF